MVFWVAGGLPFQPKRRTHDDAPGGLILRPSRLNWLVSMCFHTTGGSNSRGNPPSLDLAKMIFLDRPN